MDLQTLKFFCAIAEEGSVSKAAQKLHYAQSNLSTKIMQLEQELQTPLFYRNSHGVTLTSKGELLQKYAINLINLAEETVIAIQDQDDATGNLAIGCMESIAISYLPSFLTSYHDDHPNVSVQVKTNTTELLVQQVLNHTLNGAFVAGPIKHPEILCKSVRTEQLVIISNISMPNGISYDSLLQQPLLVFPMGCTYRKILHLLLQQENLIPSQQFEFNSLGAILASVSAGLGIALFPKSLVDHLDLGKTLSIHSISSKFASVETIFIYKKNTYLSSAMRHFIEAIGT